MLRHVVSGRTVNCVRREAGAPVDIAAEIPFLASLDRTVRRARHRLQGQLLSNPTSMRDLMQFQMRFVI